MVMNVHKVMVTVIFTVFIFGIILGISFPQKQIITGKNPDIQVTIQAQTYFWFLTTFRVIEKNISDKPIYIENNFTDIVLRRGADATYIPGGPRELPSIPTQLQPNEPRISKLYFKFLYYTKYALTKKVDWGTDSTSIKMFVLRGVLSK